MRHIISTGETVLVLPAAASPAECRELVAATATAADAKRRQKNADARGLAAPPAMVRLTTSSALPRGATAACDSILRRVLSIGGLARCCCVAVIGSRTNNRAHAASRFSRSKKKRLAVASG